MKARDRQNPQSISARCRRRVGIARRRTRIAGGRSQADPFSDAVEGSAKLAGTFAGDFALLFLWRPMRLDLSEGLPRIVLATLHMPVVPVGQALCQNGTATWKDRGVQSGVIAGGGGS